MNKYPWNPRHLTRSDRLVSSSDRLFISNGGLPFEPPVENYKATWIWLDCEMTSLKVESPNFRLLEVCMIVTDAHLHVIDELKVVLHRSQEEIDASSTWCQKHFKSKAEGGNGLFEECLKSTVTEKEAMISICNFLINHVSARRYGGFYRVMLAGNSVYFDRMALLKVFPKLEMYLSHRTIDVSSLLEIVRRFRPDALRRCPTVAGSHRVSADILESINLLRWFRSTFLSSAEMF